MGGGATNLKRDPSLAESLPACLKVNRMTILVGSSVDVVLLPVEGRVGLDDDALFGPVLEFFD